MKKITLLFVFCLTILTFSQAQIPPQAFNYSAVARNTAGQPLSSTTIGIQISILKTSTTGAIQYSENHLVDTDAFGLFNLVVGGGAIQSGNMTNINWSNDNYFLQVGMDANGGTNFLLMGTAQFLSVPYALHAKTAENLTGGIASILLPPTATIQAATNVRSYAARLNCLINGNGLSTTVVFEWGLTTNYGNTATITQSPVTGSSDVIVNANITGIQSNTTYNYRIIATNAVNVTYSNNMSFTTGLSAPQLTTSAISSISATTASSGGNITYDGGSPVTARGVCWSTNPQPTIGNSFSIDGTGAGAFISNMTALNLVTTHYVRAYATNSVGTAYGNELSFTTVTLPIVTTSNFTNVKGNSANAGGSIINNGGSTITAQGLCWSTSPNPTIANSFNTSFTGVMSGLIPNTVYYVRAYANNIVGTAYGNQLSFNSGKITGTTFAGGLVFYNDGNGNGLVCAPTDQSDASWGCNSTTLGGTSTAMNTGAANTNAIVAACTQASIAARICYNLNLNTYSDWFLPSRDELYLMYANLHTLGLGSFTNYVYFSSSESNFREAWIQNFDDGSYYPGEKSFYDKVRAVRAF